MLYINGEITPKSKEETMTPVLCFIACEYLYPEMKATVALEGFSNVEVKAFPARCGRPPMQWGELTEIINSSSAEYIELFGCYCLEQLTGPGQDFSHCKINKQEQCFHLLAGKTLTGALQQDGAYLLTPGWLAEWKKHVTEWGFDQKTAAEFFGQSLNRLLLLDTGTEKRSEERLAEFAAFLDLPSEIVPIGLDFHRLALSKIVADYKQQELTREYERTRRTSADFAMAMDLLGRVTRASSEAEVKSSIIELFTMLLAPGSIQYVRVHKTGLQFDQTVTLSSKEQQRVKDFHLTCEKKYLLNTSEDSFFLRIGRGDKVSAILNVQQVAFPQYIKHYLNVALHLSEVFALAIEHARTMEKLLKTSRLAGKAEVATEVLHNVGNTLNSISVSSEHIQEMVKKSSCLTLPGIVDLIDQHIDNPGEFFASDPRGRQLPLYFSKLSEQLVEEQEKLLRESTRQLKHVHLVAEIIRTQQDTAKEAGLSEQIDLAAIIEECLQVFEQQIEEKQINVERDYKELPIMHGERYKILQVVSNLISNAVDAFDIIEQSNKSLFLRLYPVDSQSVVLEVHDNGMGINSDILQQIFVFGFTTKADGHGFGLHNAANMATEMHGTLTAESSGKGKGSLFRLHLPIA